MLPERILEVDSWRYMTEGGRHVLFFCPVQSTEESEEEDAASQYYLMRCVKQDLAACAAGMSSNNNNDDDDDTSVLEPKEEERENDLDCSYIRDIVRPMLGSAFVDLPFQKFHLSCEKGAALYYQTYNNNNNNQIPDHRRDSWMLMKHHQQRQRMKRKNRVAVELIRDYRWWPLGSSSIREETEPGDAHNNRSRSISSRGGGGGCCWSWEIKPKAGYQAFSPLIHPSRRIKYTASRFTLMQQANMKRDASSYDPLQLFSGDYNSIRSALSALVQCSTQQNNNNNLKLWYLENRPENNSNLQQPAATRPVQVRMNKQEEDKAVMDDNIDFLLTVVARILHNEPFLPRLLQLQELDWIDADGAVLLYNQLVTKCRGVLSVEQVVELIDDCGVVSDDDTTSTTTKHKIHGMAHQMMESNPIPYPYHIQEDGTTSTSNEEQQQPTPALIQLLDFIHEFRHSLNQHHNSSRNDDDDDDESGRGENTTTIATTTTTTTTMHDDELDLAYQYCTHNLIPLLHTADLVYLLQTWLLSLAMCDVSFFVTMWWHSMDSQPQQQQQQQQKPTMLLPQQQKPTMLPQQQQQLQMETRHGWLYHHAGQQSIVYYSIKAIDCDAKPAQKLTNRYLKEALLYDDNPTTTRTTTTVTTVAVDDTTF